MVSNIEGGIGSKISEIVCNSLCVGATAGVIGASYGIFASGLIPLSPLEIGIVNAGLYSSLAGLAQIYYMNDSPGSLFEIINGIALIILSFLTLCYLPALMGFKISATAALNITAMTLVPIVQMFFYLFYKQKI